MHLKSQQPQPHPIIHDNIIRRSNKSKTVNDDVPSYNPVPLKPEFTIPSLSEIENREQAIERNKNEDTITLKIKKINELGLSNISMTDCKEKNLIPAFINLERKEIYFVTNNITINANQESSHSFVSANFNSNSGTSGSEFEKLFDILNILPLYEELYEKALSEAINH